MPQTDRQTDKSVHWNSAIFDHADAWAKLEVLPSFVKEVHKQKEVCPTTGAEHWQCHVVCNTQQRLSALRGWIQTHWKQVKGAEYIKNSIAYCSKKDTAVAGTATVVTNEKYLRLHELLMCMARRWMPPYDIRDCKTLSELNAYKEQVLFKNVAKQLVETDLVWIDKLSNPVIAKMWDTFHNEVLDRVREDVIEEEWPEDTSLPLIIEGKANATPERSDGYAFLD